MKEFTLDKTKYFPYIVECYVSLQKILEFPHFQSFLTSFRDQIAEGSLTDKYLHELFRIEQYFFQKKQEFEMLVYEVETTVTLLVSEVRNDLQNKISANSRLESLQYQDRLTLLSKNRKHSHYGSDNAHEHPDQEPRATGHHRGTERTSRLLPPKLA